MVSRLDQKINNLRRLQRIRAKYEYLKMQPEQYLRMMGFGLGDEKNPEDELRGSIDKLRIEVSKGLKYKHLTGHEPRYLS